MAQRSIRFPDEVAEAIGRECVGLDRTFTWWVVDACRAKLARGVVIVGDPPMHPEAARHAQQSAGRVPAPRLAARQGKGVFAPRPKGKS